jgi:hypothetical protein
MQSKQLLGSLEQDAQFKLQIMHFPLISLKKLDSHSEQPVDKLELLHFKQDKVGSQHSFIFVNV